MVNHNIVPMSTATVGKPVQNKTLRIGLASVRGGSLCPGLRHGLRGRLLPTFRAEGKAI